MIQLFLHILGDFILQNDWMGLNKKKKGWEGFVPCVIHCTLYSLPFLFIGSWLAVSVIFITHFLIDRYKFIDYFIAFKNNVRKEVIRDKIKLFGIESILTGKYEVYQVKKRVLDISNFGFSKERPVFISIWLYIIVDNSFHIFCNYIALKYL